MEIRRVLVNDGEKLSVLAALADEIYHEYYSSILALEQIDYMVDLFLSEKALRSSIDDEGYDYYLFYDGDDPVAFFGVKPGQDDAFLSKLYIRSDYRGKGLGSAMIGDLKAYCKAKGLKSFWLTCNKYNEGSLAFYRRMGFILEREEVSDIGHGYVMDDYVFRLFLDESGASFDSQNAGGDGVSPKAPEGSTPSDSEDPLVKYADEIAQLPKVNLGALFLPALWGPTHGHWVALLFYPLWVFVDSCVRASVVNTSIMSVSFATISVVATLAFTVFFARTCEPRSFIRQAGKRSAREYLRRERVWAIICLVMAIVIVCVGTYYNLMVYLPEHM